MTGRQRAGTSPATTDGRRLLVDYHPHPSPLPSRERERIAAPFGNIRGYGCTGTPDLAREAVQLIPRECLSGPVDFNGQLMSLKPYLKVPEVLHVAC